jgi:serine/threonine protein phosphatase PrpC
MTIITRFFQGFLMILFLTQCGGHDDSIAFMRGSLGNRCAELSKLGYRIYCDAVGTSQFYLSNDGYQLTAKYFLVDDTTMNTFFAANQLTEESFKTSAPKVNAFINGHSAISDLTATALKLNSGRTVNISGTPASLTIDGLKATVTPTDGRLLKLQGILPVTLP